MKKYKLSDLAGNSDYALNRDNICFFEKIHTHDYFEIEYIFSGEGVQVIDGISYTVREGDAVFIPPGETHSYYSSTDMQIINCCFSESALSDLKYILEKFDRAVTLTREDRSSVETLLGLIEEELGRESISSSLCRAYVSAICSIFKRNTKSAELPSFWQPIITQIAARSSDITLDDVCRIAHMSKTYFCRKFKSGFGMTFIEYLSHIRIQRAKQLLLLSELSVTEIMQEVGCTNAKLFYKSFKTHTGMTPVKYRQERRKT